MSSNTPEDRRFAADLFNPPAEPDTPEPGGLLHGNTAPTEATDPAHTDPNTELRDFTNRLFGNDPNNTGAAA